MTPQMGLTGSALLFVGLHFLLSHPLRKPVTAALGDKGFQAAYSLVAAVTLVWMVVAYRAAPTSAPLWPVGDALWAVVTVLMLLAAVLLMGSLVHNPAMPGQAASAPAEARGVFAITRHPMLWSFALWAAIHLIGNGDTASIVFFGAFLVTALAGMPSIDAKLARRSPEAWARLAPTTSILPFGAIAAERNRLALREIGWLPALMGLLLWAALLHLHGRLFGVAPVSLGNLAG